MKDFFARGVGARLLDDTVVVLLDADMILLNALDSPLLADAAKIAAVTHGKPLAQVCHDSRAGNVRIQEDFAQSSPR